MPPERKPGGRNPRGGARRVIVSGSTAGEVVFEPSVIFPPREAEDRIGVGGISHFPRVYAQTAGYATRAFQKAGFRLSSAMARLLGFVVSGLILSSAGLAQEEPPRVAPKPSEAAAEVPAPEVSVKKVGETRYRLGEIEFDAKTREIRFPVVVNMREGGPVEYLLVHENGKVHESILTTAVSPLHLQIVMKLLRYQGGHGDVFNRLLTPELIEKEGGKEGDRGEEVTFTFEAEGGKSLPVYEMIIDGEKADAMAPGGWIYTGSAVQEGTFMAEAEGSIIAIYLDHLALFNMTRDGADIDERWGARHTVIPEIGTKGVLTIRAGENPVTKKD